MMDIKVIIGAALLTILLGCATGGASSDTTEAAQDLGYRFPDETELHEGTWLQWPHSYTYGKEHQTGQEPIWIEMTAALTRGENVHIVAYNTDEQAHIQALLKNAGVDMARVDFYIHRTDDVWARDNGPMFVRNRDGKLLILDFAFNGWGGKTPYRQDQKLRERLSLDLGIKRVDSQNLVMEGGSIELDSNGTLLATRSAIVNKNRNPKLTESDIEQILRTTLGVQQFIWLDGVPGIDITDFHIDGFAKFHNGSTIITMNRENLAEWGLSDKDIQRLYTAKDLDGAAYSYVYLPLTSKDVVLENGRELGYKGSYVNFYIANAVVLVPFYNDPQDQVAAKILQELFPKRAVIGIDVRELYLNGGMLHCVTQQQPAQ